MLSRTPPLGFNTWNTFGEDINEEVILRTADRMVELGLRDAGYEYLVIDDCWSKKERDPETGKIVPDETKFPHGMKYVSDYVHSKGLKFGMYSCAGLRTCADYPASFDHEYLDAETFAEYGVDFLKYDYCYKPETANGELLYRRMALALRSTGRDILFSACNWGCDGVNQWARSAGAHMYRSTGDIFDNFTSFKDIFESQLENFPYSAPGCFNDMDMMIVGMRGNGNVGRTTGCTDSEYRLHFCIWAMFNSPIMLGCDIRKIDDVSLALVKNPKILRINQDEEGRPPYKVCHHGEGAVYAKVMSDNEIAVLVTNFNDEDGKATLYLENMGIPAASGKALEMTDVFTDETTKVKEVTRIDVKAHDCRMFICKVVNA